MLAAAGMLAGANAFLGNRQLIVDRDTMYCSKLPDAFEGKKIMLMADLHRKKFGKDYCNLLDTVRAASPDMIIMAGDLYSRGETKIGEKVRLLTALNDIAPTYYTAGNHEPDDPELLDAMLCKAKSLGVHALKNELAVVCSGGERLNIYGLQLPLKYFINKDGSYHDLPVPDENTIARYLGTPDSNCCNLLIAHNPLFFPAYEKWGADLVLSGHVHGGIARVPFWGKGILSPRLVLFPKYDGGLFRIGKSSMVVSRGLGMHTLHMRFWNPGELVVLELNPEET